MFNPELCIVAGCDQQRVANWFETKVAVHR
jgi:hypothetical protein